MTRRVLVTGGAGFIGAGLVTRLLEEGHEVAVLDNFFRGKLENLKEVADHPSLTIVEGDVRESEVLQSCHDALGGVDLVHHLAAINGTKWFHEAAMNVIDVNINGTLATLRKAAEWGARFVLASSPEAYGDAQRMPLKDTDDSFFPPAERHQRFSYGASKYLDEVALQHLVGNGLDGRIVRPFNAYGVQMLGDAYGQVVGMMFNAVRNQQPINVHGDGAQTRSFTHLDDIVEGFYLAGELEHGINGESLSGSAFNLGSEEEVSMLDLAHCVNGVVGSQAVDIVLQGGYPGDSRRRLPSCEAAEQCVGWKCTVSLQDGLAGMWATLKAQP